MFLRVFKEVAPVPTSGTLTLIFACCLLFGIQKYLNLTMGFFSVGASVFEGHVHTLLVYPFYHKTFVQLLPNIIAFVFLSGSMERGFGTVRFLYMFCLQSVTTGLAYALLALLMVDANQTEGLLPVALACMALTTMHTRMTKGFLCGVSFPTIALPWMFLIITAIVIPGTVLPCNIIAIFTGWMYGRGWFSLVQMSEAQASVLEKMMPFRFLRSISYVTFVPASTEERRKTLLPQISSTPGSYPVQAYSPVSTLSPNGTVPMTYEGWPSYTNVTASPLMPLYSHTHTHGHSHSHLHHGQFGGNHLGHNCNHSHSHNLPDSGQK